MSVPMVDFGANAHPLAAERTLRLATVTLFLVAAAIGLLGCAHDDAKPGAENPPVNLSGYSAAFKEGFKDGCESARKSVRRENKRYAIDPQYAQGWQDGRAICGKR
jgi:hypothetical protein